MRRWALLVTILYLVILFVLTAPLLKLAFLHDISLKDTLDAYSYPGYWIVLAIMAVSQFALLAVPVRIESRRPVTRGALWPTVLAAALATAALFFGAASSVAEFLLQKDTTNNLGSALVGCALFLWIVWSVVFYRFGRTAAPEDFISRLCKLMFKGSILELLIALPTHIVARYRNYCCAGVMTFIGLSMGIAVMLFSFGPSVFFLYAARWRRLHPQRIAQM